MEPPQRVYRVGAWTPERLARISAALLIAAHLGLGALAALDRGGHLLSVSAHLAPVVFYLLLFFGHVPLRPGLLVVVVDGVSGAALSAVTFYRGAEAAWIPVAAGFALVFLLGAAGFGKLPRHERW